MFRRTFLVTSGWDGSGISNARVSILPGLTHYTIFPRLYGPLRVTAFSPTLPCRELREHADSLPPMDACVPQSTEARLLLAEGERPFAHTRAPNG